MKSSRSTKQKFYKVPFLEREKETKCCKSSNSDRKGTQEYTVHREDQLKCVADWHMVYNSNEKQQHQGSYKVGWLFIWELKADKL